MLRLIGISPHPPLIIPAIGRGELKQVTSTVEGMKLLSSKLKAVNPELIIFITPHGTVFREGPAVLSADQLEGSFAQFGFPEIRLEFRTDRKLLELLREETLNERLKPVFLDKAEHSSFSRVELDHGVMVPLYYLKQAGVNLPGLHLTFGFNSFRELYQFGKVLKRAADKRGLPYVVLASGDLSHRLIPGAPAGYSKRGAEYDHLLIELFRKGQVEDIVNFDPQLVEDAGECGLRSFLIALGMLDGVEFKSEIISYEGPFGVGYLVAALYPEKAVSFNPAGFARKTLEEYFNTGRSALAPEWNAPEFSRKAGAFVSLKKGGHLGGCIGTIEPVRSNLADEIAANAISAALQDPRFPPLSEDELAALDISVDVLSPLEPVDSKAELNPEKYGVLVRSGARSGLLLPDLEGVNTVDQQVEIASRKAGIRPGEPVELFRFTVTRYKEK